MSAATSSAVDGADGVDAIALAQLRATVQAAFHQNDLSGLAPGLIVTDPTGWLPATALVDGSGLPAMLAAAARRWRAAPHAAAALAWNSYTYWLALPPVLAWAATRRVPLMHPSDVLVQLRDHRPVLTLGLRPTVRVAVLPGDPLALAGARAAAERERFPTQHAHRGTAAAVEVVQDEAALLAALRGSLLDAHLAPMLERIQHRARLGTRTLLGSLASGVAYGIVRATDALPGAAPEVIGTLLDALDVADLVDLVPGADGKLTVQRKTCCLAFSLPEPKICSGCCIRPAGTAGVAAMAHTVRA